MGCAAALVKVKLALFLAVKLDVGCAAGAEKRYVNTREVVVLLGIFLFTFLPIRFEERSRER